MSYTFEKEEEIGMRARMRGMTEDEKISEMNRLIADWREPGLPKIKPRNVIPDTTNRENTGISPAHCHYIACKMADEGFKPFFGDSEGGHELPIVVRENTSTRLGTESVLKWGQAVADHQPAFPDLAEHIAKLERSQGEINSNCNAEKSIQKVQGGIGKRTIIPKGNEFFTSLGNGHFFQALNLFATNHPCLFDSDLESETQNLKRGSYSRHFLDKDKNLKIAVEEGVECVVLRAGISEEERKFVSKVLNDGFGYTWNISPDGSRVFLDRKRPKQVETSLFEGLSKGADSFELDEVVRQHMRSLTRRKKTITSKL